MGGFRLQVPRLQAAEAESLLAAWEDQPQEEPPAGGAPEGEGPGEVLDAEAVCPLPSSAYCPACRCPEVEAAEAPDWAPESRPSAWLSALVGRGWWRCTACGHLWKR